MLNVSLEISLDELSSRLRRTWYWLWECRISNRYWIL